MVKAGKLRALAVVVAANGLPDFPDVPTFAESGYPELRRQRLVRPLRAGQDAEGDRR